MLEEWMSNIYTEKKIWVSELPEVEFMTQSTASLFKKNPNTQLHNILMTFSGQVLIFYGR